MIYFKHVLEADWVPTSSNPQADSIEKLVNDQPEPQDISADILGGKNTLCKKIARGSEVLMIPFTRGQLETMILADKTEDPIDFCHDVLSDQQREDFTDYCNDWGIGAEDYEVEVMHTITFTSKHTINAVDEDDAREQIYEGGFSYEDVYTTCEADGAEDSHYVEDQDYDIQYVYKSDR